MERDRLVALLDEGLSLDGIALRIQRSPSTVSYWLAKYGLHANGAPRFAPRGPLDRETLAALVAEGLSGPEIAQRLGCSYHMVRHWLKRHGLKTRQARNRDMAREALARDQRLVELACREHGLALHVLEGRGSYRCCLCRASAAQANADRGGRRALRCLRIRPLSRGAAVPPSGSEDEVIQSLTPRSNPITCPRSGGG
jgi:transposase